MQRPLHCFYPQLLFGGVHIKESLSAQVKFLKARVKKNKCCSIEYFESQQNENYLMADPSA